MVRIGTASEGIAAATANHKVTILSSEHQVRATIPTQEVAPTPPSDFIGTATAIYKVRPIAAYPIQLPVRELPVGSRRKAISKETGALSGGYPAPKKQEGLWHSVVKHGTHTIRGAVLPLVEGVQGAWSLSVGGLRIVGAAAVSKKEFDRAIQPLYDGAIAAILNPGMVLDGLTQPYVEGWRNGRPAEAIARGL